jgi:hypothetical protein
MAVVYLVALRSRCLAAGVCHNAVQWAVLACSMGVC